MRLVPIASDGWRFIIPLGVVSAGLLYFGDGWVFSLGIVFTLLAVFCVSFFRDFDRDTKVDDSLIYSPGDGKILEVATLSEGEFQGWRLIRIFLSVFDGHIQRVPVRGHIKNIAYKEGLFLDARDPRAHFENEQNMVTIASPKGTVMVNQIAGLIARRIVCWVKVGQELKQGERYGLIRFGSQVDVMIPSNTEVKVAVGDRVLGGKTVLSTWRS